MEASTPMPTSVSSSRFSSMAEVVNEGGSHQSKGSGLIQPDFVRQGSLVHEHLQRAYRAASCRNRFAGLVVCEVEDPVCIPQLAEWDLESEEESRGPYRSRVDKKICLMERILQSILFKFSIRNSPAARCVIR